MDSDRFPYFVHVHAIYRWQFLQPVIVYREVLGHLWTTCNGTQLLVSVAKVRTPNLTGGHGEKVVPSKPDSPLNADGGHASI